VADKSIQPSIVVDVGEVHPLYKSDWRSNVLDGESAIGIGAKDFYTVYVATGQNVTEAVIVNVGCTHPPCIVGAGEGRHSGAGESLVREGLELDVKGSALT